MVISSTIKIWIKKRDNVISNLLYEVAMAMRAFNFPTIYPIHNIAYILHVLLRDNISKFISFFYSTPIFKSRLKEGGSNLYLYNGIPYITGPLIISIGDRCRISGKTTFSARAESGHCCLVMGDNVDINWQTTIAVGVNVLIGNNVRIAGNCFISGYPGHPVNPEKRAAGFPDTHDQIGDIIIEDDVWIATGVTILPKVTIGKGAIIGAGSVVTHDIPAGVMAAGNPARPIKHYKD